MDTGVIVFVLVLYAAIYAFGAYVWTKIGNKLQVGSFGAFLIPIYNLHLIFKMAGFKDEKLVFAWIGFIIPYINLLVMLGTVGLIAKRLGRDPILYGIGTLFFGIPILILAFGDAKAVQEHSDEEIPSSAIKPSTPTPVSPINEKSENPKFEPPSPKPAPVKFGIHFTNSEYAGNTLEIPSEGIVLGRDPNQSNLIFHEQEISRTHLKIEKISPSVLVLSDLGSSYGTTYSIKGGPQENLGSMRISNAELPVNISMSKGRVQFDVVGI